MRRRATKKQVVVSICLLAAVAGAGYLWWPHLWWSFLMSRNSVKIPSVPTSTLEAPGKTDGWYKCSIGPLSLKLPPELSEKAERAVNKTSISFTTSDLQMMVHIPHKMPPDHQAGLVQAAEEFHESLMHLIADSYRESTDDFRWSMSHAELRRHQILLNLGAAFPHFAASAVETRYEAALEGLLIINNRRSASFEWRTKSGAGVGFITFSSKDKDLDLGVVRDICLSVKCDENRLGPAHSTRELKQILEAIEITRDATPGG
jgi:hypothetical protein